DRLIGRARWRIGAVIELNVDIDQAGSDIESGYIHYFTCLHGIDLLRNQRDTAGCNSDIRTPSIRFFASINARLSAADRSSAAPWRPTRARGVSPADTYRDQIYVTWAAWHTQHAPKIGRLCAGR